MLPLYQKCQNNLHKIHLYSNQSKIFNLKLNTKFSCLKIAIQNNLFNTTNYLLNNHFFMRYPNSGNTLNLITCYTEIYITMKEGIESVRQYFDRTQERLHNEKKKPILMRPPFQWAQNLHTIQIEVKYAYRHDVSGCATLQNETVKVNETALFIQAFCMEQDNYLQF